MSTPSGPLMYGVMSIHAPVLHHRPTLSTPNDRTESGGWPELIAAVILLSVSPVRLSTVIHGYFCWKPSKILLKTFVSAAEVHSLHIDKVTGAWDSLGLIVCAPELSLPELQATAISAITVRTGAHRFIVASSSGRGPASSSTSRRT